VRHLEIEHHLQDCSGCEQTHESIRALRSGLTSASLYHKPPAGLRERIQAAGRRADIPAALRRRVPVRWLGFAAAAALALLAFGLGRFVFPITEKQPRLIAQTEPIAQTDFLAREIVSSHVRSLMMDHIADIKDSNEHVVKPWFGDKVTYTLTVKKLSDEGFPLFGGRVDHIEGQRVATLIYQRNQHFINLYVWPASNQPDSEPQPETRSHFNLLHWVQDEQNYWAISDLNDLQLRQFADLVRKPR
jgi:anti-sigma factor RsiW